MSQSNSFNKVDSWLAIDSPMSHSQNVSRFSRLLDRSTIPNQSLMATPPGSLRSDSVNRTMLNLSDNFSPIGPKIHLNTTVQQLPPPVQDYDSAMLTDDEMSRLAIFESFFQLNQKFQQEKGDASLELQVFDLMDQFECTCEENRTVSQKLFEQTNKTQAEWQLNYLQKFANLCRLEQNIWCLFKVLLGDRFMNREDEKSQDDDLDMDIEEDFRLRLSDFDLVARSLKRNQSLREMQVIIDWLEQVYEDDDGTEKITLFADGPYSWENTLHHCKVMTDRSSFMTKSSAPSRPLCNELDPDGPIRTGLPLHDLDKEDEHRLFHHLFKMIRGGKLQDAKATAERFGYLWLSAALEGWMFYHDPNHSTEYMTDDVGDNISVMTDENTVTTNTPAVKHLLPVQGNPFRDLWKYSAWNCSRMEGTNVFERAMFAAFSGNRSVLMPSCPTWMDKLWAFFKCSLDAHLENILFKTNISRPEMQPRTNVRLPDLYWDNRLSATEIFQELDAITNSQLTSALMIRLEEKYFRMAVKDVILGKIDSLVDHLHEWSKTLQAKRENRTKEPDPEKQSWNKLKTNEEESMAKIIEPNLLRLFAHLAICLKELRLISEHQSEKYVEILEIYIGFLIEYKLVELIAFYTSFLPETKQVRTFATLLETIDDESDRRLCLIIAKNSKLNVAAILTMVVENIRLDRTGYQSMVAKQVPFANFGQFKSIPSNREPVAETKGLLSAAVTESDIKKIQSLDWLLLDGDQPLYVELLWQANAMIRAFMLEQKIDQAWETYAKLPSDVIGQAYREWKQYWRRCCCVDIGNLAREYLCHTAYFEANESFKKWHNFLYTTKPREPVKPKQPFSRIAEKILYEQRWKQYEQELELWQTQIGIQASNTAKKLLTFLKFPYGIWTDVDGDCLKNMIQDMDDSDDENQDDGETIETEIHLHHNPVEVPNGVNHHHDDDDALSTEIVLATNGHDPETRMMLQQRKTQERQLVIEQLMEQKRNEWNRIRPEQLDRMRRIYVPQYVLLLHSVYRDSGNLAECMRCADLVADEHHRLYSVFTRQQLQDFLAKIRETAVELLHHVSDPFGYSESTRQ